MFSMPSQIETYQEMSVLSAKMVEAARASDWDTLVALERSVSALRDTLSAEDDNADIAPDERAIRAGLIRQILEDDAEIRRHTEPWMEHVKQFLGQGAKRREVERAYGVAAG